MLVSVTAPPVDGRANEALCRLIAKAARIAPSRVRVTKGLASRDKTVEIEGLDEEQVRAALGLPV